MFVTVVTSKLDSRQIRLCGPHARASLRAHEHPRERAARAVHLLPRRRLGRPRPLRRSEQPVPCAGRLDTQAGAARRHAVPQAQPDRSALDVARAQDAERQGVRAQPAQCARAGRPGAGRHGRPRRLLHRRSRTHARAGAEILELGLQLSVADPHGVRASRHAQPGVHDFRGRRAAAAPGNVARTTSCSTWH